MESKICCYEMPLLQDNQKLIDSVGVPQNQKYYIDLSVDPSALNRIVTKPVVIVLTHISTSDKLKVASSLARIFINYNPVVFCMDCNIEFMKHIMRYESLRLKMSDNINIIEDIKQLALSVFVESDESYEF
mgnify:CR=1 FL=1